MSEDSAAAGTAEGGVSTESQDTGTQGAATAPGTPGLDDRSPEEMLGEAVSAGDGDNGTDDLSARLAKLEKQNASLQKHSRTWETRAKENAEAAQKLRELEDRDKTELQRVTDRASAAEQRISEAEERATESDARYFRTLAAATYGLPPALIGQISGATEDECNDSAEALAKAINETAASLAEASARANGVPAARAQSRPVESLRPGAVPAGTTSPQDPNAWLRGLMGRQ